MSIDRWMDKDVIHNVVHMYNVLLSHKKGQNNAICCNMDATRDYHTRWSKSERERQTPNDITYVESKIWHNEYIYKTEVDSQT